MAKRLYLTIDDSPSRFMSDKIAYLKARNIPAIFFCRGEFMKNRMETVIEAIQAGFLIGNHSYTHPYFSRIPLGSCFEEIQKTEILIQECYQRAGITQPLKTVRLPFGDRGAGVSPNLSQTQEALSKVVAIHEFLKLEGYQPIPFEGQKNREIHATFTWDVKDYKREFIQNPEAYLAYVEESYNRLDTSPHILLVHDFDHSPHLFEPTMKFLEDRETTFLPCNFGI